VINFSKFGISRKNPSFFPKFEFSRLNSSFFPKFEFSRLNSNFFPAEFCPFFLVLVSSSAGSTRLVFRLHLGRAREGGLNSEIMNKKVFKGTIRMDSGVQKTVRVGSG